MRINSNIEIRVHNSPPDQSTRLSPWEDFSLFDVNFPTLLDSNAVNLSEHKILMSEKFSGLVRFWLV